MTLEHSKAVGKALCLFMMGILLAAGAGFPQPAEAQTKRSGVAPEIGQELKEIQRDMMDGPPAPARKVPVVRLDPPPAEKQEAETEQPSYKIAELRVRGDVQVLSDLGLLAALEKETVGRHLTGTEIRNKAARYQAALVKEGYYLAQIQIPDQDYSQGILQYEVDIGRVGRTDIVSKEGEERVPFTGRYYSQAQIADRLVELEEGSPFDYGAFYRNFYTLNVHPDLTVDADLNVRTEEEEEGERRYVDMTFEVEERLPLHGVLSLNNSGTDVTDEWGAGLTLQYLNLTRHDDVVTVSLPVSLDLESIRSVAGSYYLPYSAGNGGSMTVYGGYSRIDASDLVPGINLDGEGWFVGGELSYSLIEDPRRRLRAALGLSHSDIEDTLLFDEETVEPRQVTLSPMSLGLVYSDVAVDRWGGRNSVGVWGSFHVGDFLGASDDEEFSKQRLNAPADYVKGRLQVARVQSLFASEANGSEWILYGDVNGQFASDPLIPAEQTASDARGYISREVLADEGVSGTLELRTPVIKSDIVPGWFPSLSAGDDAEYEKLQFITFLDGAYLMLKDTLPGEDDNHTFFSAGLGFRVSVGDHVQARFDWGFPIEETVESDSSGRGHMNVQIHF